LWPELRLSQARRNSQHADEWKSPEKQVRSQ
jgi:hypothetical protein